MWEEGLVFQATIFRRVGPLWVTLHFSLDRGLTGHVVGGKISFQQRRFTRALDAPK